MEELNVLLLEDNPSDARLMQIYMRESSIKHKLFTSNTLANAFDLFDKNDIHFCILDLYLPDSTGIATVDKIKERYPDMPTLLWLAQTDLNTLQKNKQLNGHDYLQKGQINQHFVDRILINTLQKYEIKTKLKYTEIDLQNQEQSINSLQTSANVAFWQVDLLSNKLTVSSNLNKLFGCFNINSIDEFTKVLTPESSKNFLEAFLTTQKEATAQSVVIQLNNGKKIECVLNLLKESHTNKLKIFGSFSEHKINENNNDKILEELKLDKQSQKVRKEVLENMAFDTRTPLSSVVSLAQVLSKKLDTSADTKELNDAFMDAVDELSKQIGRLLNYSVYSNSAIEVKNSNFELRDFISAEMKFHHSKINKKSISIILDVAEELPNHLSGDTDKLHLILFNLLEIAINTSTDYSKINIDIEKNRREGDTLFIEFTIRDNGEGISQTIINKINNELAPSETEITSNEVQLHSYIFSAKKLTEQLGGTFIIQSRKSRGSKSTVVLPVNMAMVQTAKIAKHEVKQVKKELNILVVDDHIINKIATKKLLENWSKLVKIVTADNGQEAVDLVKSGSFDIVLMDLQMPVMNGFDATKEIRTFSQVPILALTANQDEEEANFCRSIGFNSYITKPFKPDVLYAEISEYLSL
jgi:CheY-like chemotaxis protein